MSYLMKGRGSYSTMFVPLQADEDRDRSEDVWHDHIKRVLFEHVQ